MSPSSVGILTAEEVAAIEAERTNYVAKLLRSGSEHAVWAHVERLLATIAAKDAEIARLTTDDYAMQVAALINRRKEAEARVAQLEAALRKIEDLASLEIHPENGPRTVCRFCGRPFLPKHYDDCPVTEVRAVLEAK